MNHPSKQTGFTLIELMVTIGILAILAAIAYPSFARYIQQTRIQNTRATMTKVIYHMEKVYAQRHSFCETGQGSTCATPINTIIDANDGSRYNITMPLLTDNRFVLQSVPQNNVYTDTTLANNPLNVIYDSTTTTFARCNSAGFATATANNTAAQNTDPGSNCEVF